MAFVTAVAAKQMNEEVEMQPAGTEKGQGVMVKKSVPKVPKAPKKVLPEPEETSEEVAAVVTATDAKPFAEDAHEFLKILGKWVLLKSTHPSGYNDYHEATRKWLEKFKSQK